MLDRVHLYKYLGLMVDDHLNINKHNQDLHKIVSHKLFMLLCEAMILPILEYGDIIYEGMSAKSLLK